MDYKVQWFVIVVLMCLLPLVVSGELDQETRLFIQAENSKMSAQTQSRIEQSFNAIDAKIAGRFDAMEARVTEKVTGNLIGALKALAVGMFGMVLIGLAAFKLIEYKLSTHRRIQQYEAQLLRQQKELDVAIAEANRLKEDYARRIDDIILLRDQTGSGSSIPASHPSEPKNAVGIGASLHLLPLWQKVGIIVVIVVSAVLFIYMLVSISGRGGI